MAKFIMRLVRNTGRGLALQEALYGFIMAMLFITASAFGLINVETNMDVIILIVGMNFSWGAIDMVIFYFIDVAEQKKHFRILRSDSDLYDDKKKVIKDNLSGTIVDCLDDESEDKVVEIVAQSGVESEQEEKEDRKDLFKSAFSSFVITMLTTIPPVLSLLIVDDLKDAFMYAGFTSSVCMFFVGYLMGPYLGTKGWFSGLMVLGLGLGITIIATFTGG